MFFSSSQNSSFLHAEGFIYNWFLKSLWLLLFFRYYCAQAAQAPPFGLARKEAKVAPEDFQLPTNWFEKIPRHPQDSSSASVRPICFVVFMDDKTPLRQLLP
jgi:hypothetical protein